MRRTSATIMVFFFERGILKVTWSHLWSKFLLHNYEAHWKQHFERHPTVEDFKDLDQDTFFFSQKYLVFKSTHCWLTYWIVFALVYLHFYILIIDIWRILKFIQCLYTFLIRFWWGSMFFFPGFSLVTFLLCLFFHETFLPVNSENNSWR